MNQKPLIPEYDVKTTSQTRQDLTKILADFRAKGKKAVPIIFGSHRKPEAVLVPAAIWQKVIDELDDLRLELIVQERLSNPQDGEVMTLEQYLTKARKVVDPRPQSEDAKNNPDGGI